MDFDRLLQFFRSLHDHQVEYVLVGGVAMNVHGLEDLEAEVVRLEGVPIRIATPRTLYRMKRDTLRIEDRGDAERLRERFGLEAE